MSISVAQIKKFILFDYDIFNENINNVEIFLAWLFRVILIISAVLLFAYIANSIYPIQ